MNLLFKKVVSVKEWWSFVSNYTIVKLCLQGYFYAFLWKEQTVVIHYVWAGYIELWNKTGSLMKAAAYWKHNIF